MRIRSLIFTGVAVAALGAVEPATAQSGCADIDFNDTITDRFPNAGNACLGIEARDGREFAHFQAEIVSVSGNRVRAKFRLPDGSYSETYSFETGSNDRVELGGRSYRYRELSRGQELDIYIPHDRWEFHIPEEENFEVARTVAIVTPMMSEGGGEPAVLPSTASALPLLGIAGSLLVLAGLGVTVVRRRLAP